MSLTLIGEYLEENNGRQAYFEAFHRVVRDNGYMSCRENIPSYEVFMPPELKNYMEELALEKLEPQKNKFNCFVDDMVKKDKCSPEFASYYFTYVSILY